MNIKDIAATLAILGSGALMVGCGKDKPATEVPAGDEAAPPVEGAAEAKCGEGHPEGGEGHCGAAEEAAAEGEGEGEAAAEGEKTEGSCGGK